MRFTSGQIDIEAWVEVVEPLQLPRKFAEHREEGTYDDKTGKTMKVSYLEIEEGKSFRIKLRCIRPANGVRTDMKLLTEIDGRPIRSGTWRGIRDEHTIDIMYVVENGVTKQADLTFASLPKTDEEQAATVRGQAIDRLCKIDVFVQQGKFEPSKKPGVVKRTVTDAKVGMVHEKQLKLGSTVQGANVREVGVTRKYHWTPAKDSTVCRFVWNYHTRAQLSLMGITEDDHLPAAPVVAAPPPAMSALAAFAAQLNQSVKREAPAQPETGANGAKRIKNEQLGTGAQNQPISIAEGEAKRQNVGQARVKAEVIDLTGD